MKNIRLLPVAVSIILSAAVLFGGWFIYHSMAMEQPLSATIQAIPGVNKVHTVEVHSNLVEVEVALAPDAHAATIWERIHRDGSSIMKDRELSLHVVNASSDELEAWWGTVLFDVAESMEHHTYGRIPTVLEERSTALTGLQVNYAMDDTNVYVRLNHGDHVKFMILPRIAPRIGVWSYE